MADKRTGRARQGTHPKAPSPTVLRSGTKLYSTTSGQAAQQVLTQAARGDKRVAITVLTKGGDIRPLVTNRGHNKGATASWLKRKAGKTSSQLKGFIASLTAFRDSDTLAVEPIEVDEIETINIAVMP